MTLIKLLILMKWNVERRSMKRLYIMKKLLGIVVLGLFLITPSQADDIRDIQIEGISIGDSALDYFSEEKILNNRVHYFKDKKFTPVEINYAPFFEVYWKVSFAYKSEDKKYIIERLSGSIDFSNNIGGITELLE